MLDAVPGPPVLAPGYLGICVGPLPPWQFLHQQLPGPSLLGLKNLLYCGVLCHLPCRTRDSQLQHQGGEKPWERRHRGLLLSLRTRVFGGA